MCYLFQGPCCRTCEEFSPDGLYFSWISAFSNSGILEEWSMENLEEISPAAIAECV